MTASALKAVATGNPGDVATAAAAANKNPVVAALTAARSKMASLLPAHITPEKMLRIALNEMRLNQSLASAAARNPESLVSSVMLASQLGLEIGGAKGHGYLVPYGGEVKFMPGYRGLIDLARRTGQVTSISVHVVYQRDEFSMQLGISESILHKPFLDGDRGAPKLVYGVAHFTDGSHHFDWMSMEDVERVRKLSKNGNSGPWKDHYGEMVRKTMVRRLAKYLPMSSDRLEAAVQVSDAVDAGRAATIEGDFTVIDETGDTGAPPAADPLDLAGPKGDSPPPGAPDADGVIETETDFAGVVRAIEGSKSRKQLEQHMSHAMDLSWSEESRQRIQAAYQARVAAFDSAKD